MRRGEGATIEREAGCSTIARSPAVADYNFADQIGHLLRRAYQRHLAIFQAETAALQVTSTQFVTLCALRDNGASSQAEIVGMTGIDQATIRGILDRLRRRKLVETRPDSAGDKRKVVLRLTPAGSAVLDQMVPCALRISEKTMGDLNPAERLALDMTLRAMIRNP
jgi:DNA-binding MarR family transcriptional regulator